jgi:hypothetical protein
MVNSRGSPVDVSVYLCTYFLSLSLIRFSLRKRVLLVIFYDCEIFPSIITYLKGTVARDFGPLVFFMNQLPMGP